MRRLLLLLPCLLLAACGSGGLTPLPGPHATAGFPPGGVVGVIVVDTLDNLPLRAAELVAPDGAVTLATTPIVDRKIESIGGQSAAISPWRGDPKVGGGSAMLNPIPNAFYTSDTELLLMASTADITLPDPVAYRRDWGRYRIRLTFGAPGAPDIREIPAPQPPPS